MFWSTVLVTITSLILAVADQSSGNIMSKLAEFEERFQKQENMIKYQNSKINALETQLDQRINEIQQKCDNTGKVKKAIDGGIAFSVFMNHDGDFGAGQVIKFNQVITNEGNGYNVHTGVFTCPEAGMYLLSFFVGERGEQEGVAQIYADLKVNSKNVMDAVAETRHYQEDAQGGNTVVMRLAQGDSVWINSRGAGHHIEGDASRITSFTGIFLYA